MSHLLHQRFFTALKALLVLPLFQKTVNNHDNSLAIKKIFLNTVSQTVSCEVIAEDIFLAMMPVATRRHHSTSDPSLYSNSTFSLFASIRALKRKKEIQL
jgi:hypothetical protein